MFPGGQKRERESEKDCLRREIKEELPKLKLGRIRLWKKVNGTNRHSGRIRGGGPTGCRIGYP
jgi:8-oxo-dGTP diphosphatase